MTEDHLDSSLLERFMRNEADGQERRAVVRHLLAGCSSCLAVTRHFWRLGEADPAEAPAHPAGLAGYAGVFTRLEDGGVKGELRARTDHREAPLRLTELLDLPRPAGLARIEAEPRFQTPAVCELLIGESQRTGEPALAAVWAEWAVAVAERLDARRYGATLTRSLVGRSWAWLGNARRLVGDLHGAAAALAQAEAPLEEGLDAIDGAELLELRARLLADQGKLEEAERLLDGAFSLYRTLGERHLQGRVLIQKGTVRGWAPGPEAALQGIRYLQEGLALLDENRQLPLVAFGLHRLALLFADAGRAEEATRALRRARTLYGRHGDGPNLVRLRHLEGKIAEALGAAEAAEAAFLEARQGFVLEGLGMEAAGVLLDLAIFYTRTGRSPELRLLTEDLLPILRTRDLRQGVAAALLFLRRLVETGHATLGVLSEVSRYVTGPPRERRPALR
jgi:tetratricopeptide (TPR) repeat protein